MKRNYQICKQCKQFRDSKRWLVPPVKFICGNAWYILDSGGMSSENWRELDEFLELDIAEYCDYKLEYMVMEQNNVK